jgi:hypothetical protein
MRSWYNRVVRDPDDLNPVFAALEHFNAEYQAARTEVDNLHGRRMIEVQSMLPGIVGYRYEQFMELSAILGYLEIRTEALLGSKRRHYIEHYNRALSDRMVEKYAETDSQVIAMRELCNHVVAVKSKFEALSRQHEYLHYQLGHMVQLRKAGLEDAIL